MKKIILSTFVIIAFIFYVAYQRLGSSTEVASPVSVNTPVTLTTGVQSQVIPPAPQVSGQGFKDGQYIGDVADALYGNVQVKAIVSAGRLTDVQFLQYPSDRRTSIAINTQAMPMLTEEAIVAQSARVDTVTGASQTSRAFKESLQSALNKAR